MCEGTALEMNRKLFSPKAHERLEIFAGTFPGERHVLCMWCEGA